MIVSGAPLDGLVGELPPTLVDNLRRGACRFGSRPLLLDGPDTVSHAGFAELVEGAAERLRAEGLRPGDRLAVALRNGVDAAVAIYACARGGFLFVGLPITLKAAQWSYLLEHCGARLVLSAPEFLDRAWAAAGDGVDVREVGDHLTGSRLGWREEAPLPDPDDVYGVVYTSGTTGRPKAATLTHRATMHVAGFYQQLLGLAPEDRTAIHLPFYYVSGHVSQLNPFLLAGGSAVLMPRFSADELVSVLRDREVTVIDVVPSIFDPLLRVPEFTADALPGLRAAYYGGAPMPPATVAALRQRMPRLALHEVYGMSETGGIITCLPDGEVDRHPGGAGRPVPGADVCVTGEAGASLPAGQVGELRVRGPMVMPRYLADPDATDAALDGGWLRTGDLARIDADGYVSVVGRTKDMIIRGGAKVYPAEVEGVLASHPAVAEAAVFGVPDELAGEAVVACVVAADGASVDITTLRSLVRERMATHAVPRHVRVVDSLPRNATGKLNKQALRERLT